MMMMMMKVWYLLIMRENSGKGEQLELDELLPPPAIENGQSDAKGGDGGARPSGCARYTQLINQRCFDDVHNWTSAEMSPLPPTHLEVCFGGGERWKEYAVICKVVDRSSARNVA